MSKKKEFKDLRFDINDYDQCSKYYRKLLKAFEVDLKSISFGDVRYDEDKDELTLINFGFSHKKGGSKMSLPSTASAILFLQTVAILEVLGMTQAEDD